MIDEFVKDLLTEEKFKNNIIQIKKLSSKPADLREIPEHLHQKIRDSLYKNGIESLFSHQASAVEHILNKENVVIVTPTASGKTLCYNIPVLDAIVKDPKIRAIYLFPTKALSQDQYLELYNLNTLGKLGVKTYTYDGDTPSNVRRKIRDTGQIVITNPDMLHMGILPHHTKWLKLFRDLKYVVIDEIHTYRGIFGSHLSNVIKRMKRILNYYGADPTFILCSATIHNPVELSEKVIGEKVVLVNNNGAPRGEKFIILYNPPLLNQELGIRKNPLLEVVSLGFELFKKNTQTIIFGRSRIGVEVILSHLRKLLEKENFDVTQTAGYRGGYLPNERREIEKGIKDRNIISVVSTNALELGIDIGNLDACIVSGYPGAISSLWQQIGRAGRRSSTSLGILVASSNALDQYLMNHPEYVFRTAPESGIINPDNLIIKANHIKCATFEIPFTEGEKWGEKEEIKDILDLFESENIVKKSGNKYHWSSTTYPADSVSLRSASSDNCLIINISNDNQIIGEVDRESVPFLLYEGAIYIHGAQQYQVKQLDLEGLKAFVEEIKADYYTEAQVDSDIRELTVDSGEVKKNFSLNVGDVLVTFVATLYKKIKFYSFENIGAGDIHLPEQELQTTAFWIEIENDIVREIENEGRYFPFALEGLGNILSNIIPLYILSDPTDIGVITQIMGKLSKKPMIYIYDRYPGGVGFAEKIFKILPEILTAALELVKSCGCNNGCPSCLGPYNDFLAKIYRQHLTGEKIRDVKGAVIHLIQILLKELRPEE
ncbi:MAG: DEAD/DEAH box helicase [bacterium]|nr:DEAD/DEAH box helicase [bacterium]